MSESTERSIGTGELIEHLRASFADEDYRNAYADSFSNSYVAAQIKLLREEYPMTQGELAEKIGTKQPGIARLENVNYSTWKVETLRKLARALRVRLKITFEEWGTLAVDIEGFKHESLLRRPFDKDPVFSSVAVRKELGAVDVLSGFPPSSEHRLGSFADDLELTGNNRYDNAPPKSLAAAQAG